MMTLRIPCAGGGYDYDFVDAIQSKYQCVICQCVLREARLTECCGQNFCDSCLKQSQSQCTSNVCPHCRTVKFRSIRNLEKIREINEFRVRCCHHKKGCPWIGKLEDFQGHLRSDQGCIYAEIKCHNFGFRFKITQARKNFHRVECEEVMERWFLREHHRNKCKLRQYTCQYCGYIDTYDAITGTGRIRNKDSKIGEALNHYRICGNFPVQCPNKCATGTIKRKDMKTHRQTCPLEPLDCQYITVGCKSKILRRDMDLHCQEHVQAHLLMVLKSNNELFQQNKELVHQNQELTDRVEEMEQTEVEFRARIDELERDVQELQGKVF